MMAELKKISTLDMRGFIRTLQQIYNLYIDHLPLETNRETLKKSLYKYRKKNQRTLSSSQRDTLTIQTGLAKCHLMVM